MPQRCLLLAVLTLAPAAAMLPAAAALRLEQSEGKTYLVQGTQRLLLIDPAVWPWRTRPEEVRLPDGSRVAVVKNGSQLTISAPDGTARTVEAVPLLEQWPQNDEMWGGHKAANDLRYLLRAGPLTTDAFSDLTAVGPAVLAVLNWHGSGSGEPIVAQYLVRVDPVQATVKPVRQLDVPPSSGETYGYSHPPLPRLLKWRERLLLYSQPREYSPYAPTPGLLSTLSRVDVNGNVLGVQARFPAHLLPAGLLDQQWLILTSGQSGSEQSLWALDLPSGKLSALHVPKGYAPPGLVRFPDRGRRFLAMLAEGGSPWRGFVVALPGGRSVALPKAASESTIGWVWGDLAILFSAAGDQQVFLVYDAKTGKLLQRLEQPPAR